jgi:hypothetical protein
MNRKHLLRGLLCVVASSLSASPSLAYQQNLGIIESPKVASFYHSQAGELFTDSVRFSVLNSSRFVISYVANSLVAPTGETLFGLGSGKASIFNLSALQSYGGFDTKASGAMTPQFTFLADAGKYTLDLTGKTTGSAGGQYFISFAPVAPVPEPATWASMMAGLALASGAVRYKRRKVQVSVL